MIGIQNRSTAEETQKGANSEVQKASSHSPAKNQQQVLRFACVSFCIITGEFLQSRSFPVSWSEGWLPTSLSFVVGQRSVASALQNNSQRERVLQTRSERSMHHQEAREQMQKRVSPPVSSELTLANSFPAAGSVSLSCPRRCSVNPNCSMIAETWSTTRDERESTLSFNCSHNIFTKVFCSSSFHFFHIFLICDPNPNRGCFNYFAQSYKIKKRSFWNPFVVLCIILQHRAYFAVVICVSSSLRLHRTVVCVFRLKRRIFLNWTIKQRKSSSSWTAEERKEEEQEEEEERCWQRSKRDLGTKLHPIFSSPMSN